MVKRKRHDAEHERNGSVPAAFVGAVGMPAVEEHGEEHGDVGNDRQHGYGQIGHAGCALKKSGKPDASASRCC